MSFRTSFGHPLFERKRECAAFVLKCDLCADIGVPFFLGEPRGSRSFEGRGQRRLGKRRWHAGQMPGLAEEVRPLLDDRARLARGVVLRQLEKHELELSEAPGTAVLL